MQNFSLPVIANGISCEGCGVCCLEQQSPPLYLGILRGYHLPDDPDADPDDFHRIANLPAAARKELEDYRQLLAEGGETDEVCIWFDRERRVCRYYEHRPSICREFEMGGENCREWRNVYHELIITPMAKVTEITKVRDA